MKTILYLILMTMILFPFKSIAQSEEERHQEAQIEIEELTIENAMTKAAEIQYNWDSIKMEIINSRVALMDNHLSLPLKDPVDVIYDTIVVKEINSKIAYGPASGYQMKIYRAIEKDVAVGWKQFIKGYKAKLNAKNRDGEYFVDDAFIPSISNVDIDITSTMQDLNGDLLISTYFDMGGVFLNGSINETASANAKKLLYIFGVQQMKAIIEDKLRDDQKEQEKIEKDLYQLRKKNENVQAQINKLKEQIVNNEKEVVENLNEQDSFVNSIKALQIEVLKTQMMLHGVK